MKLLFKLILLLWTFHDNLINGRNTISHRGMKKVNAECFPENSCLHRSLEASRGVLTSTACSCDRLCSRLGTCCKDSPYVGTPSPEIRPHCKTVHSPFSTAYFMIDRCPNGDNISLEWHSLCEDDWNGEDVILKFAPVTSLSTSITYKNYFCFKCHEMGDDVFYWDIHLLKESEISDIHKQSNFTMRAEFGSETAAGTSSRIKLEYSTEKKTWMAAVGKDNNTISVVLEIKVPKEIGSLVIGCDPNVISNCSTTWNDANVRYKCDSYTAVIYIAKEGRFLKYKNAYCALCNFESLDDMYCMNSSASVLGYASGGYRVRNVDHAGDTEIYGGSGQHAQQDGGHRSDGGYAARGGEYGPGGGRYVARSGGYSTRSVPGEGLYGPRGGENRRNGEDETNRRYAGTYTGGYEGRTSIVHDERSEGERIGGYGKGGSSGGYGRETRPGYGVRDSSGYGGGSVSRRREGYRQGGSAGYGGAGGEGYAGGDSAGYGRGYDRRGTSGYGGATGEEHGEGVDAGYGEGYRRGATGGYEGYGGEHGVGVGGYGREYSKGHWATTAGGYRGQYPTPPYRADAGYQGGYVRRSSAEFGGAANVGRRRVTGRRKRYFSFVDILRVNKLKSPRKTPKCDKNFLWDPYSETCLELICDNPALELKEGQCV